MTGEYARMDANRKKMVLKQMSLLAIQLTMSARLSLLVRKAERARAQT